MKTNLQRYIPSGMTKFTPDLGDYPEDMFACYANLDSKTAIFYVGKQSKHTWYARFHTDEDMKNKIKNTISNIMSHNDMIARRKTERKEKFNNMDTSSVNIGDVYHWSGGYNCTRNGYIKVTEKLGKNKFSAVHLPKRQVDGDWMNGNVAPVLDGAVGDALTVVARPDYDGGIRLRDTTTSYRDDYSKWSGKPNWENCD